MVTKKKDYDFGEKLKEYSPKDNEELPVWKTPKYEESKAKAIEMIASGKYNLSEGDFWILMNRTKTKKMAYTGLIISHNGCLKINDASENKVNPKCFSIDKNGYNESLVFTYVDGDTYEVGEFSSENGKNGYPYAMAFKRCFDRVVLKKSKLAYSGIYSEVEADEFKKREESEEAKVIAEVNEHQKLEETLDKLITDKKVDYNKLCKMYKLSDEDIHLMSVKQLNNAIENIDKFEKVRD